MLVEKENLRDTLGGVLPALQPTVQSKTKPFSHFGSKFAYTERNIMERWPLGLQRSVATELCKPSDQRSFFFLLGVSKIRTEMGRWFCLRLHSTAQNE